jgi:hypothetical protein
MKQFFLFQLFWMASFTLSAQSNAENTLKAANPAVTAVEIPSAEQTLLRVENPLNKATENTAIITDQKIQNPSVLPTENPIHKNTELVEPKKH